MTHTYPISTADRGTPALASRTTNRIAKAWHAYWQKRVRRVTVALLHSLDDRALHDIGVSRNEITSVVYGTPGGRTRRYDEAWRLWHVGC
jgi:uncharacterized protein YjiS (DUF1127 family)